VLPFFTWYPYDHGAKDQAAQAEIAEIAEAIRGGIGCRSKNALGLGDEPLAAKQVVERANWRRAATFFAMVNSFEIRASVPDQCTISRVTLPMPAEFLVKHFPSVDLFSWVNN
jgi:hypothetical protein